MNKRAHSQHFNVTALWNARDGIAALEFALVAPVLVLLFTCVVGLSLGLRTKMEVENAARAGATYAASNPMADDAAIRRAAQEATILATNVRVNLRRESMACMNSATGTVSVLGSAVACAVSGAPPGTYLTVTTTLDYTFVMPIPGMESTTVLSGKAVSRIP